MQSVIRNIIWPVGVGAISAVEVWLAPSAIAAEMGRAQGVAPEGAFFLTRCGALGGAFS